MRFRTKLLTFIIPLLIFPILVITLIFINNTRENVSSLQFDLMGSRLNSIQERAQAEHGILTRLNLDGSPFYVRSAQTKIFEIAAATEIPGGYLYITNESGEIVHFPEAYMSERNIIHANNAHERLTTVPVEPHQFSYLGETYVSFHTSFEPWNWHIVAVSKERIIYEGINAAIQSAITSGAVVTAIGLVFLFIISQSISKPVEKLISGSRRISEGDLESRVILNTGDEFQELAEAYNEMASKLSENFSHIQEQMAEIQKVTSNLRESEETLKGVFNQAFQLIGLLDTSGRCLEINDTGVQFVNTSKEDMIGAYIWETPFWNGSYKEQEAIKRYIARALDGELVRKELLYDGKINLDFSLKPVFDENGKVIKMITEARDITDLKQKERELAQLNEELEERIQNRTQELVNTNAELLSTKEELEASISNLQQAQEQLIESEKLASLGSVVAGISHEVNTPLGIAVTLISHIHKEIQNIVGKAERNQLTRAAFNEFLHGLIEESDLTMKNLKHASELISGFKMIAVDQSSHEMRRFELNTYLHEILNTLHPQLKKTSHTVSIDCPDDIHLSSYPGALFQIISNLIMNTLVHGFHEMENGHVSITAREVGAQVEIQYTDDGHGISEENQQRIFEPFYTTARGRGSSGLGLHIVYNLCSNVLGGNITLTSAKGEGVTFVIRIPKQVEVFR